MEPMFEETIDENYEPAPNSTTSGPVFLVKEDGVTSEQTFLFTVQVANSTFNGSASHAATSSAGYRIETESVGTDVVLQFPAEEQRIPFEFTLLPDTFPENTQVFLATFVAIHSFIVGGMTFNVPTFLPPVTLSDGALIKILDDDRKLKFIIMCCKLFMHDH